MIICSSLSLNEQLLVKVLQKLKLKDNITPTRFGKYLMQLDIFSIDSPVRLWPTKSALCEAVPSSALQWFRAKKKGGLTCIPLQLESMAPGWQKHTHGGKKKKKNCFHRSLRNVYQWQAHCPGSICCGFTALGAREVNFRKSRVIMGEQTDGWTCEPPVDKVKASFKLFFFAPFIWKAYTNIKFP